MVVNIYQNIDIRTLNVGSVTNSSVLQIGSAGCIHTAAHLYNTGGFTAEAPSLIETDTTTEAPLVPLVAPSPS
ncbi:MAG TPA: spore germination protein GerPB [Bacillales bacterium]|nr:spore germination protein GerPB [Bacillales bacterium]